MTALATKNIQSLSSEIHTELDDALKVLKQHLNRVEGELDLECANLRDLVNQRNPEIQKQLDALSNSITELHESLADVRTKLNTAHQDSEELNEATRLRLITKPTVDGVHLETEELLSPQEAGRMRHDEKITLGGIFRALFMAEEPGQRFTHPSKKDRES